MRFVIATALLIAFTVPILAAHAATETSENSLSVAAPAGDASSTIEQRNILGAKKFPEDKRITDLELKAQAGSLSRYSLKFDLSYAGPPIDNLSDPEMPNPDNRPRANRTSLAGYMGGRYRVNSNEAWNFSTGLKWFTPYQTMAGEHVDKGRGDKDYEIANPQVAYDRTYPMGATQGRTSFKGSYTTADYYVDRGQRANIGVTQALKYTVLQSRWILGGSLDFDYYYFEREYNPRTDGRLSNYNINLIPSLEYKVRDSLNLRTSVAYTFTNMRMRGSWYKWDELMVNQRLGVGWALTRDVYFNPYITFFPGYPAIRTTSLSFSTVFSIF
jgi:hypothetical protein